MKVSEALATRRSTRGFLDRPVDQMILHRVLETALLAPSGGNVQPWSVAVLTGQPLGDLKAAMSDIVASGGVETPEYTIYPPNLPEPYRSRRFAVGEQMYSHIGIAREDKAGRAQWFANNFQFFGAPIGLFVHMPRFMLPPQWADLGIFLQSVMLMLREEGLDSCPQECWTVYPATVRRFVSIPAEHILFAGMSIGYADPEAPANRTRADRASLLDIATFVGFPPA
ncbi:MAG: nitroreductase [Rhizorhabdus sp.]|nr:nitroreductase [Rhizorhabdus sp.]